MLLKRNRGLIGRTTVAATSAASLSRSLFYCVICGIFLGSLFIGSPSHADVYWEGTCLFAGDVYDGSSPRHIIELNSWCCDSPHLLPGHITYQDLRYGCGGDLLTHFSGPRYRPGSPCNIQEGTSVLNSCSADCLGPECPDCESTVGGPIQLSTGNMYLTHTDARVGEEPLKRTYNSRSAIQGPLGYGWRHTYQLVALTLSTTTARIFLPSGKREIFTRPNTASSTWMPGESIPFLVEIAKRPFA